MFKKPKRGAGKNTAFRKRTSRAPPPTRTTGDDDDDENGAGTAGSSAGASAGLKRGRPAGGTSFRASKDDSSSDEEDTTSALLAEARAQAEEQKGRRGGRPGGGGGAALSASSGGAASAKKKKRIMHEYGEANDVKKMTAKEMATRGAEHHPEEKPSSSSGANDKKKGGDDDTNGGGDNMNDGVYRGLTQKRNAFHAGPLKAPTFVRTTCRFDYQPDICKDYKETGFCGFGDTCIYLHDRGDTLNGWQLEQQWEEKKKLEREKKEREMDRFLKKSSSAAGGGGGGGDGDGDFGDDDDGDAAGLTDDGIPFACFLCRNHFTDPVMTSCGHYYCQRCIMDNFQKNSDPLCPVCRKDTHGVFNHPTKLHAKKRRVVGRDGTWEDFALKSRPGGGTTGGTDEK